MFKGENKNYNQEMIKRDDDYYDKTYYFEKDENDEGKE